MTEVPCAAPVAECPRTVKVVAEGLRVALVAECPRILVRLVAESLRVALKEPKRLNIYRVLLVVRRQTHEAERLTTHPRRMLIQIVLLRAPRQVVLHRPPLHESRSRRRSVRPDLHRPRPKCRRNRLTTSPLPSSRRPQIKLVRREPHQG